MNNAGNESNVTYRPNSKLEILSETNGSTWKYYQRSFVDKRKRRTVHYHHNHHRHHYHRHHYHHHLLWNVKLNYYFTNI